MALARTALDSLNIYGSDSSDEDVPGPRVSTKRTHKDDDCSEREFKRLITLGYGKAMKIHFLKFLI